ncbi:MAG TPA: gamma carbonic anhydrase family protein [Thermoleophilaceae bacterium]
MAMLVELDGVRPTIGRDVFLAPTAVLIGDVRVADRANIWFGAVLRGDFSHIEIGEATSVQDNTVMHCAGELPTIVGREVTIGHGAILEGCVVEDRALVGMGAILCQRSRLGSGAMLAAGAVLSERTEIGAGMLGAGVPAREKKELSGSAKAWTEFATNDYQGLRMRYLSSARFEQTDDDVPLPG